MRLSFSFSKEETIKDNFPLAKRSTAVDQRGEGGEGGDGGGWEKGGVTEKKTVAAHEAWASVAADEDCCS